MGFQISAPGFRGGAISSPLVFPNGTILTDDAANILAQRNGTNAQEQRWYYSFTDTSNYSRAFIAPGRTFANQVDIGSVGAGTGATTLNALSFIVNGVTKLNYNSGLGNSWYFAAPFNTFKGTDVASAAAIAPTGNLFHVTGTTTITSITATGVIEGFSITIIFDGVLTLTDGSNLKLAGNFVTTADDTITLTYDGTSWFEVARSAN